MKRLKSKGRLKKAPLSEISERGAFSYSVQLRIKRQFIRRRTKKKIGITFYNPIGLPLIGDEQDNSLFMIFYNHGAVNIL